MSANSLQMSSRRPEITFYVGVARPLDVFKQLCGLQGNGNRQILEGIELFPNSLPTERREALKGDVADHEASAGLSRKIALRCASAVDPGEADPRGHPAGP